MGHAAYNNIAHTIRPNTLKSTLSFNAKICWHIVSRIIILLLCIVGGFALIVFGSNKAHAVTLKPSSTLEAGALTVGDIFDDVDNKISNYVLGPGPNPGEEITLNAWSLQRVAIAMDLDWRPSSSTDQIVVRRNATIIEEDQIKESLDKALRAKGLSGEFNIQLTSENAKMIIPSTFSPTVEVSSIRILSDNSRFTAQLKAPSVSNAQANITVHGVAEQIVKIPVLASTYRNEDIIRARDITWIDIPENDLQHDIIVNEQDLIGMTPRRMVLSGRAIRDSELIAPQIVKRGELVTIQFKSGALLLTAEGKALENGAKDDLIRIVNTESSRALEGRVIGDQLVLVQ